MARKRPIRIVIAATDPKQLTECRSAAATMPEVALRDCQPKHEKPPAPPGSSRKGADEAATYQPLVVHTYHAPAADPTGALREWAEEHRYTLGSVSRLGIVWIVDSADTPSQQPDTVNGISSTTPTVGAISSQRLAGREVPSVALPAGASPRELVLALRLLCEVIRLKHQLQTRQLRTRRLRGKLYRDSLTGLYNRRGWEVLSRLWWRRHQRGTREFAVAVIDLDHFKRINDEHGHAAGDTVLRETGQQLRRSLRAADRVFRLGGDEFAVLLAVATPDDAAAVVERVRHSVSGVSDRVPEAAGISASAGVIHTATAARENAAATEGSEALSPESLLDAADRAMLRAKAAGRNRTHSAERL